MKRGAGPRREEGADEFVPSSVPAPRLAPRRGREDGLCSSGLFLGYAIFDDAEDIALLHDQEILAVDLDLGAGPLAEQHAVAGADVDRDQLAGFVASAGTNRDHLALRGLFLDGVGNDDAAGGLFLGLDALDDDAVVKRAKLHGILLSFWEYSRSLGLAKIGKRVLPIVQGAT